MRSLDELRVGAVLGRYELLAPVARGGMAAVWLARDESSSLFALKTLLPALSDDPKFETMLVDEARLAAAIDHPNVVRVLEIGEAERVLFVVMEWVDGEPLSVVLREATRAGGLPLSIAAALACAACDGLHAAHELTDAHGNAVGLVHRDVSPQNVLVGYDGTVKLSDFGVAKAMGNASYTSTGQLKGKPSYMSPEQALSEPIDRRSDVFSMGIVVHQLITGAHPFREESDFATVRNILSRPPRSLRELAPDIPPAFDAAVLKALARSPSDRFATALEFREAIAAAVPPAPRHEIAACLEALVGMFARERHEAHRTALAEAKARARPRVGPRYAALAALAVLVIGAVAMAVVASRPVDAAPSGAPAAPPATSSEIAVAPPAPSATVAPATSESPVAPAATPSVRPAARKAPSPKDPASPPATTPPSPPTATAATPAKPPVATPGF